MLSWICLIISIPFIVLGAHGLYAHFHPLETLFAGTPNKLFFALEVPSNVQGLVEWMTFKGFQSFFIPVIFLGCGIGLIWFAKNRGFHFSLPIWGHSHSYKPNNRYNDYRHSNQKSGFAQIAIKIILSLLVILGIILLIWFGYRVFTHEITPLFGAITFLIGIAIFVAIIWLLRKKYIWYAPSFKLITLIVVIVAVVFAFAGVEPIQGYKNNVISIFIGNSNNQNPVNSGQQKTSFKTGNITWEVVLKSIQWSSNRINTEIIATNRGTTPADFPYENVDPIGVVVSFGVMDSYNMWYSVDGNPNFDVRKIYPGESRTFKPTFTVNARSGELTLYVTRYTGTSKFPLFHLKSHE
jgi:hypothetical protein